MLNHTFIITIYMFTLCVAHRRGLPCVSTEQHSWGLSWLDFQPVFISFGIIS